MNLPHVLPLLDQLVDEIVLVDGSSTDDTVAVARLLVADVRIVHQTGTGKGDALRAGFAVATGDIVVTVDADGSTCPTEIPAFVGLLLAGADYVKGSRFLHGGGSEDISAFRRAGNSFLVALARLMHGGRYSDLCYGYNAFWRRCLDDLRLTGDGFEIETIMNVRALRAGLDVREVPSYERRRRHGESNLRAVSDGLRVLRALVRELGAPRARPRFRRPWRPTAIRPEAYLPPFAFRAVAGGPMGAELIVENRPEL
jgi:glycosyltransferase involved in cell wall biosynthesis